MMEVWLGMWRVVVAMVVVKNEPPLNEPNKRTRVALRCVEWRCRVVCSYRALLTYLATVNRYQISYQTKSREATRSLNFTGNLWLFSLADKKSYNNK